jgi:hypothetical protein
VERETPMTDKKRNSTDEAGDTVVVTFRIPVELAERLKKRAEADDRTQNRTAARLLRFALDAPAKAVG